MLVGKLADELTPFLLEQIRGYEDASFREGINIAWGRMEFSFNIVNMVGIYIQDLLNRYTCTSW